MLVKEYIYSHGDTNVVINVDKMQCLNIRAIEDRNNSTFNVNPAKMGK